MPRFFLITLTGLILTSFVYAHQKPSKNSTNETTQQTLVQECMLARFVLKKQSRTNTLERMHRSKGQHLVWILLLSSGDIATNPGPVTATYFSKKLKPCQRVLLSRLIKTQKKYIESMLHGRFLQKYTAENVPPPGLKFKKTAQIRNNDDLNNTWQQILDRTSLQLNHTLIQSHERNSRFLATKLTSLRSQVMECLSESCQKQLQNWLQGEAISYRERTRKKKEKKFDKQVKNHMENQPLSKNISPNNKESQTTTSTPPAPTTPTANSTSEEIEPCPMATAAGSYDGSPSSPVQHHMEGDDGGVPDVSIFDPPSTDTSSVRESSNSSSTWKRKRRSHRNHVLKDMRDTTEDDDMIVNLSDYELTEAEKNLLKKGLKFVPTPMRLNRTELAVDTKKFSRRMRLKEFFADQPPPTGPINKFKKSTFTPEFGRDRTLDNYLWTLDNTIKGIKGVKARNNLTDEETEALESLRSNQTIVIFPADKGGALVIQNRASYIESAKEHLESKTGTGEAVYQRLQSDCTTSISRRVNNAIDEAMLANGIDKDTAEGLKVNNPKPGNLYCLPKIHKNPGSKKPPPRPICNSRNTPTEKISQWVDEQLQPLVRELPSYIQDDNDFLRKIRQINDEHTLPPGTILATWDVKSLYTNIPHEGGMEGCRYFLSRGGRSINVVEIIMKFIGLILNCNIFGFGNAHYLQKCGTAMGTKMAPSYANLFMGFVEKDLLERCEKKPLVWFRYIDDIFFVWTHGKEAHDEFLAFCNNNPYGLIFEVTPDSVSTTSIPFLDIRAILQGGKLQTDLYVKPTDKFQYLNFTSSHPYHQKASLPYGLALRIKRICSNQGDFKRHCEKLVVHLRRRGFKLGLIKEGIRKASLMKREDLLAPKEDSPKDERMIFSTTYNPMVPDLREKIHNLQHILHSTEKCKKLFPHPPLVAYRRNRSLNDLLVSRRLPPDTEVYPASVPNTTTIDKNNKVCEECGLTFSSGRGKTIHYTKMHSKQQTHASVGFSPCGDKRCNTCTLGTFGTSIPITSTGSTYTIKHHLTCKSSNVVYCVTCKKCRDQYIGETDQELHARQRGHLSDIRTNKQGIPYVEHFRVCGIENYTITCVEQVRQNSSDIRKARETFYKKLFDVKIK